MQLLKTLLAPGVHSHARWLDEVNAAHEPRALSCACSCSCPVVPRAAAGMREPARGRLLRLVKVVGAVVDDACRAARRLLAAPLVDAPRVTEVGADIKPVRVGLQRAQNERVRVVAWPEHHQARVEVAVDALVRLRLPLARWRGHPRRPQRDGVGARDPQQRRWIVGKEGVRVVEDDAVKVCAQPPQCELVE
eukprot:scaffold16032_cov63-Phaeocystis_antarctica.AAC.4